MDGPVSVRPVDQALGLLERERPQEDRIHHAEYGGVGPDAQGQRGHGHQREARRAPEAAQGIGEVLAQGVHARP